MIKRVQLMAAVVIAVSLITGCQSQEVSVEESTQTGIVARALAHHRRSARRSTAVQADTEETEFPGQEDDIDTAYRNQVTAAHPGNIDYTMQENIDKYSYGVDYGILDSELVYYSTTAQAEKGCSVLLPAGYTTEEQYPVIYFLHGFNGDNTVWFNEEDQLRNTYGNMIASGEAAPAIVVTVDMYTDPIETYVEEDEANSRFSYDKFGADLVTDLMPFIAANYSIKTGPENTAILGESQGATEALAIAFQHQDIIGYVASIAPCSGVIPTEFDLGTFWNVPLMEDFVIADANQAPYILLTVGEYDDGGCFEPTLYYDEVLTAKGISHDFYILPEARHDGDMWQSGIYNFVKRIFGASASEL